MHRRSILTFKFLSLMSKQTLLLGSFVVPMIAFAQANPECADPRWSYNCKVDSMTDQRQCVASSNNGSNLFVYAEAGRVSFAVIGEEYPGEPSTIRIDKNKAISFNHDVGTTRAQDQIIENQIKKGTVIRTRHIQWPSGISRDNEAMICNLPDVIQNMKAETKKR